MAYQNRSLVGGMARASKRHNINHRVRGAGALALAAVDGMARWLALRSSATRQRRQTSIENGVKMKNGMAKQWHQRKRKIIAKASRQRLAGGAARWRRSACCARGAAV
jgi:hypothetical protein